MATLAVQEAMGLKVDREAVATLVLPQLWAMSMGPLLTVSQFKRFMDVIKKLGERVEKEHDQYLRDSQRIEDRSAVNGRTSVSTGGAGGVGWTGGGDNARAGATAWTGGGAGAGGTDAARAGAGEGVGFVEAGLLVHASSSKPLIRAAGAGEALFGGAGVGVPPVRTGLLTRGVLDLCIWSDALLIELRSTVAGGRLLLG